MFVSDAPVTADDIRAILEGSDAGEAADAADVADVADVAELMRGLNAKYEDHGLQIVEIAGGFQLRTKPELGEWVKRFHKISRSTKLSQAALETLSMIAYRQPITRQEIEDIRGVDSSGVLKNLLDKNLIKSLGRKRVPGKPVTFGTTRKFLEYFGLVKLGDLPTLKDLPGDETAALQERLRFEQDFADSEAATDDDGGVDEPEDPTLGAENVEESEGAPDEEDGKDAASKNPG
ncbi:MAG: SMC-Scp complex subunit ScpB [Nitrospinae bacterium]|nr:SMC-Scp complex subunit ScpB [Nitrospinota bacterium]